MIDKILFAMIVLAGIPVGLFLSSLCKEELRSWKKRFIYLSIISFIFSLLLFFTNFEFKIPIIITLFFIKSILLTIVFKSDH